MALCPPVCVQIASAALDQLPVPRVGGGTILVDEGAASAGVGGEEDEEGAESMDVDGEPGSSLGRLVDELGSLPTMG